MPVLKWYNPDTSMWEEVSYRDNGVSTPSCRVYHNANQSIPNNVLTPLAFNTERFDTDTMHDVSTNNSRITCKTPGKYLMIGHIQFTHNGNGTREITIMLNGTDYIALQTYVPLPNGRMQISTIYDLAINDYVELSVKQTSGNALDVEYMPGYMFTPEFMATRMGG